MPGTRRLGRVAALLLTLIPAAASAQKISNPDLFGKSLAAAGEAVEQYHRWDDPATLRRVADIGYRVAAASGYTEFPVSFFLVEQREPNAFALPGGQVFVTRGMIELGPDDDELAALLGHELSHVILGHGVKMEHRATLLNVLGQAAVVGVMLANKNDRPTPGVPTYGPGPEPTSYTSGARIQGAAAASLILSELLLRSYSREFEDQADENGQRIAAAAGFDPHGGEHLFALMQSRLPQSHEYGYWRTHPFFEERITSAQARGKLLRAQTPRSDEAYRAACQQALLGFEPRDPQKHDDLKRLLAAVALTAWPVGKTAERLRLDDLHRERDFELAKPDLERDFGRLIAAYDAQLTEVRALETPKTDSPAPKTDAAAPKTDAAIKSDAPIRSDVPETPFLTQLEQERSGFRAQADGLYPKAKELLDGGVYQTTFLETFLSNYPQSPETARVAFEVGNAYARTGKTGDAIARYVTAWKAGTGTDIAQRSLQGLRQLASVSEDLAALQELIDDVKDDQLQQLAGARLTQMATAYRDLAVGAEYLRRFPGGALADKVSERLDQLAEQLYGEVVLYQGVGDTIKALDRIEQILTHAPLSPAADRLRERAVLAT